MYSIKLLLIYIYKYKHKYIINLSTSINVYIFFTYQNIICYRIQKLQTTCRKAVVIKSIKVLLCYLTNDIIKIFVQQLFLN